MRCDRGRWARIYDPFFIPLSLSLYFHLFFFNSLFLRSAVVFLLLSAEIAVDTATLLLRTYSHLGLATTMGPSFALPHIIFF